MLFVGFFAAFLAAESKASARERVVLEGFGSKSDAKPSYRWKKARVSVWADVSVRISVSECVCRCDCSCFRSMVA
jgi:hypothetical protein